MDLYVDIEKQLGNFQLKMKFETEEQVLALLGASGSGKSMTLKCIAGIETPDRGRIVLDNRVLFDSGKHINVAPQERHVGYLFQQYALFPNMTVEQNIACGVRNRKNKTLAVQDMIMRMGLTGLEKKKPHQLSGGQQQRTALARILVNEPRLLLLDEPFSALDSHLRFQMEQEVRRVIEALGKPVLLVSHDRDEAYRLASHIALLKDGHLETVGEKHDVFADPVTVNGARLTGCKNISSVKLMGDRCLEALDWGVKLQVPCLKDGIAYVGIRLHDVKIMDEPYETYNVFTCKVLQVVENTFSVTVWLAPLGAHGDKRFGMELSKEKWKNKKKEILTVCMPPEAILLLKE